VFLVAIVSLGAGCTHGPNPITGSITPEHFEFTTVVKPRREDPYGWRAVCIHARISHADSGATSVCKFEVGLPIYNQQQHEVPLEVARFVAADAANRASYTVLSEAHPGEMMAVLCSRFKTLYQELLKDEVKGARVGDCSTRGIKTVHFGLPDGCEP
jgi:hypothetical protein